MKYWPPKPDEPGEFFARLIADLLPPRKPPIECRRHAAAVRLVYEIETSHRIFAKRIDAARVLYQTKIETAQRDLKQVFDEARAEREQVLAEEMIPILGPDFEAITQVNIKDGAVRHRLPLGIKLDWVRVTKEYVEHYEARCRDAWLELMDAWMKAEQELRANSKRIRLGVPASERMTRARRTSHLRLRGFRPKAAKQQG